MTWSPEAFDSGYWRSTYRYEGPGSTRQGNEFVIHASLDAGAHRHFSGIRVIICCEDIQEGELHELSVTDNVNSPSIRHRTSREMTENTHILDEQLQGTKLAAQWRHGHIDKNTPLPLCDLVFEIIDASDDTFGTIKLVLLPPQSTEQSRPILYEYIQLCTPSSMSMILFLATNRSFRGILKSHNPKGIICSYPLSMGISTHGVRILPPDSYRKPFINPPPELLYEIFWHVIQTHKRSYTSWRRDLVSFAVVCRGWRPALDYLFHELSLGHQDSPDAIRISRAIRANPTLGRGIRVFRSSPRSHSKETPDDRNLEFSKAILTILRSATLVKSLYIHSTHTMLAQDFVQALCRSPDVKEVSVYRRLRADDQQYILSITDLLTCVAHWPRLRTAEFHVFTASSVINEALVPVCELQKLLLHHGGISDLQLAHLTSSSHAALKDVSIVDVSGLTNQGLRNWLAGVGPVLERFGLKLSNVIRKSDDEEYAVDAMLPIMANLCFLELEGDVATELVLVRKPVTNKEISWWGRSDLHIENAPGLNAHGLVSAIKVTEWTTVTARGVIGLEDNTQLKKEVKTIARERHMNVDV